jgi:hypothetical protein
MIAANRPPALSFIGVRICSPASNIGCDRSSSCSRSDGRDAERGLVRFHALEKVLDGGLDEKLGLYAEPAADFLPQLDAEPLQLAAFFEHKGANYARGHAHAGWRRLSQTGRRNQQNAQRPDKASHDRVHVNVRSRSEVERRVERSLATAGVRVIRTPDCHAHAKRLVARITCE